MPWPWWTSVASETNDVTSSDRFAVNSLDQQPSHPQTRPIAMTSTADLEIPHEVRLDLALASRILAKQNVVDAFGHVSCRCASPSTLSAYSR